MANDRNLFNFQLNTVGEFRVSDDDLEDARERQAKRSGRSRNVDEDKRAPVTTNVDRWSEQPSEFDYPGIDTPSEKPSVLPKDLMAGDPRTTEPEQREDTGFDTRRIEREIEGETEFASDVVEETPRGFGGLVSAFDVSLTPGEAYEGVGAVGIAENKNPNVPVQDKFGRYDMTPEEEQEDIDTLIGRGERGDRKQELEETESLVTAFNQGDVGLREFGNELEEINAKF